MEDMTAYTRIAQKIEEQEPHTAPKAKDGSIHEAFIDHLKLVYSPEEAEVVQHLNLLDAFTSSEQVAETSGKSLEHVEQVLAEVHSRSGIVGLGNLYCLPPIPGMHSGELEAVPARTFFDSLRDTARAG